MKAKKKHGRPSIWSQELADQICERISNGETLRAVCRDIKIAPSTVIEWTWKNKEFFEQYTRARQKQADAYADMILDEAFNSIDPQIGRLRVDALKWVASKLAPKRYGDKVEVEQTGTQKVRVIIGGDA
ncbi:MAG: hypothetical protein KGR46_07675 [Verrucomicrobia bacterium]|nr:hypothetical protein [Verrucomicrobiota bacterium]